MQTMDQSWIGNKELPTSIEFSVPRLLNNGADARARNSARIGCRCADVPPVTHLDFSC